MRLGKRIRELRTQRALSQRDIEENSGLARGYVPRVEDGYEVPSLETLEALADSLDVPLFQLFCGADGPVATPNLTPRLTLEELAGVHPRQAPAGIDSGRRGLFGGIRLLLLAATGLALDRRYPLQHSEDDRQDTSALASKGAEPRVWR